MNCWLEDIACMVSSWDLRGLVQRDVGVIGIAVLWFRNG